MLNRFSLFALISIISPSLLASDAVSDSLTASLLKSSAMLLVTVAVILALAWLLKKSQTAVVGRQQNIQLLETLSVGRNERVCLIRSGKQFLLIGVSPHGITTLAEIPPEQVQTTADRKDAWQWAQTYLKRHENK